MQKHFPNDLINNRIAKLFRHSDNAGQHFKNTGALHYFTALIADRGGPRIAVCVHAFGAPGHKKGPYDGYGGTFKNKMHGLIKSSSCKSNIGVTKSG